MKYFVDEVICYEGKQMRGFYIIVDEKEGTALLEVPSDIYGDPDNLYEEEINIEAEVFKATYENGTPVHVEDGEGLGESEKDYLMRIDIENDVKITEIREDEFLSTNGHWSIHPGGVYFNYGEASYLMDDMQDLPDAVQEKYDELRGI